MGDIPQAAQAKLLRVLEDGLVRAVGSEVAHKVDVRILAATNRDLSQAVVDKTFRADLVARLSAVEVRTPPLRARPEDLLTLVTFLLKRAGSAPLRIAPDALEALALYDWPQNIRELDNVMRAAALGGAAELGFAQLPERIQEVLRRARGASRSTGLGLGPLGTIAKPPMVEMRAQVEEALTLHHGNVRRASSALGIARSHLYRLLERWNLDAAQFRDLNRDKKEPQPGGVDSAD